MTIEFIGTCSDRGIAKIAEIPGRKASYKKLCREIKRQYPDLYESITLDFYNPWEVQTQYIKHNGKKYVCMVHSAIDYLFEIKD